MPAEPVTPSRPQRRGPGPWAVGWVTVAAFLVVFVLIAVNLRDGRDPALAGRPRAAAVKPRRILVRLIYRRVVIEDVVPAGAPTRGGRSSAGGGSASAGAAPPATAPQPPPVPSVTTRTS